MLMDFMNSGPECRRSTGAPRSAGHLRVGRSEKYVERVDCGVGELLHTPATARARDGPMRPRLSSRRIGQARDREQIPVNRFPIALAGIHAACLMISRARIHAGQDLGLRLREIMGTIATASYLPAASCSSFISSFSRSDSIFRTESGISAKALSPGTSSRNWLSLKLPSFDARITE